MPLTISKNQWWRVPIPVAGIDQFKLNPKHSRDFLSQKHAYK